MTALSFIRGRSWALLLALFAVAGCKEDAPGPAATTRPAVVRPTVASLIPGATDLIVGMGAADHLVAVSTYDVDREGIRNLPRVGDYRDLDWEQIAAIRPEIMIVFMAPDRMPAALKQRADQLRIQLANVKTERLEDVYAELSRLGALLKEERKAAAAAERLRQRLEAVRARVSGKALPRALIVREMNGDGVVGRDSFIDDMLRIAGGENALNVTGWPMVDRETLAASRPDVIFHLLPGASEQVVSQAKQLWAKMPQIPAVAQNRVHILTEWYTLQPGLHLADLAELFADKLHPSPP